MVCCVAVLPLQAYHQNYYNDNPNQGYCRVVVAPKVAKFRSKYMSKLIKA
jgi:peptide-methionine (S)-S-oxide reductase